MRLDNPLDKGRTADVYPWDDGWVLKLFHERMPRSAAQHEAGLPVPAVCDILEVDGRWGLLYQHVRGPSMAQVLRSRPWTFVRAARQLAALQARVHDHRLQAGLPAQQERLAQKIGEAQRPSAAWYEKLLLNQFHRLYRRAYFRQRPGGETHYRAWRPLVAAARLSEGIEELESWLAAQAEL